LPHEKKKKVVIITKYQHSQKLNACQVIIQYVKNNFVEMGMRKSHFGNLLTILLSGKVVVDFYGILFPGHGEFQYRRDNNVGIQLHNLSFQV
jgi:hypothetical protein